MKRREAKGKVEKERYTHLNAEFQRIARRDKKAFLKTQRDWVERRWKGGLGWGIHVNPWLIHVNV